MPTLQLTRTLFLSSICSVLAACSSSGGKSANLPLTTPPVKAATPVGLGGTASGAHANLQHAGMLDPSDIQQRFFGAGPTDIFFILSTLDSRINDINSITASGTHACVEQAPVAYTITPLGQPVTFYGQCAQPLQGMNGPAGLMQFGQQDGVTYIYAEVGSGTVAATLTPLTGSGDGGSGLGLADAGPGVDGGAPIIAGQFAVEAWLSVGLDNAANCGNKNGFDDCSYGVIHLLANSLNQTFEMAVAGINIGYCGAQLSSDGTDIYAIGSVDMGSQCNAPATACVDASNISTAAANCGSDITTFALTPIGRAATSGPNGTWGVSQYPGGSGDTIELNGTSTDAVSFGPMTTSAGVGSL